MKDRTKDLEPMGFRTDEDFGEIVSELIDNKDGWAL